MKRILSIVLCFMMVLCGSVPVLADEPQVIEESEYTGSYFSLNGISTSVSEDGTKVHIIPQFSTDWTGGYLFTYMIYDLECKTWHTLKCSSDTYCDWSPNEPGNYWIHVNVELPDGKSCSKTIGYTVNNKAAIKSFVLKRENENIWNSKIYLNGSSTNVLNQKLTYEYLVYDGKYWDIIASLEEPETVAFIPEDSITYLFCFRILDRNGQVLEEKFASCAVAEESISINAISVNCVDSAHYELDAKCVTNSSVVEYKWMYYDLSLKKWGMIQDWSSNKEAEWEITQPGSYWIHVEGRTSNGKTCSKTIGYIVQETNIDIKGIMVEKSGNIRNLDIEVESNGRNLQYKWMSYDLTTKKWETIQDWSSKKEAVWIPETPGTYWLHVEAEEESGKTDQFTIGYVVEDFNVTINSINVNRIDEKSFDLKMDITTDAPFVEYRWMYYDLSAKKWGVIQEWSENNEAVWNLEEFGSYWIHAECRLPSGKTVQKTIGYVVNSYTISIEQLIIDCVNEKNYKLNLNVKTDAPSAEYRWLYYDLDASSWGIIQDWSTDTNAVWYPEKFGTYWIHAEGRLSNGTTVQKTIGYAVEEFYVNLNNLEVSTTDWTSYYIKQDVETNDPNITYVYQIYNVADNQWITLGTNPEVVWKPEDSGSYWVHCEITDSDGTKYTKTIGYVVEDKLTWPLPGYTYISSYFGYRNAPTAGASTYHQGIDIPAPSGTKILSCGNGIVTQVGYNSTRGYYVEIKHNNGASTIYMHMRSSAIVSIGQKVVRGQVIGYVGTTGVSTGNHLHLSYVVNGVNKNPLDYILMN